MSQLQNLEWHRVRLKYAFPKRIAGAWGRDPEGDNAVVCLRAADFLTEKLKHKTDDLTRRSYGEDELANKRLLPGDLIMEKSGGGDNQPVGRIVAFELNEDALCSNFLQIIRPDPTRITSEFSAYVLFSLWKNRTVVPFIKQTTGIQNLDEDAYFASSIRLPSLEVQKTIADFLDSETEQIDELSNEKSKMVALLDEKRIAFTTLAVTRGLNPHCRMKDSGHAWLGEVPTHWEVKRTKRVFTERDDRSETGDEEMLTVSHITGVTKRSEKDVNMFEAETNEGYKKCSPGNLAINTLWAWMGAMGISPEEGIVSPAYHVYELSDEILPGYVDALVRTPAFIKEVTRFSTGVWSSRLRLYPEGLFEVRIPVPPIDEQKAIVAAIEKERTRTSKFETELRHSITLLKERRAALITAAVTGEIPASEMTK